MTAAPLPALRAARLAAGLTVTDAGALIARTPSHYAKIERGECALFARDALTLARAYGVTVESVLADPVTA